MSCCKAPNKPRGTYICHPTHYVVVGRAETPDIDDIAEKAAEIAKKIEKTERAEIPDIADIAEKAAEIAEKIEKAEKAERVGRRNEEMVLPTI